MVAMTQVKALIAFGEKVSAQILVHYYIANASLTDQHSTAGSHFAAGWTPYHRCLTTDIPAIQSSLPERTISLKSRREPGTSKL